MTRSLTGRDGPGKGLIIGHVATRWGLDHFIGGVPLEDLVEQDFAWQEGWEYRMG
jgi:2,3-bisphosphoglycerate-dependent phosphoglycerate mutase